MVVSISYWDCITPVGQNSRKTFQSVVKAERNFSRVGGRYWGGVISNRWNFRAYLKEKLESSELQQILNKYPIERRAAILALSKSHIDQWLLVLEEQREIEDFWGYQWMEEMIQKGGLGAGVQNVVTACSSSLWACSCAFQWIERGSVDVVVVMTAENSLHPFLLAGYKNMGVLAGDPAEFKPFSSKSRGFLTSQTGGVIVLEREASSPYRVIGGWNYHDPTHITSSDREARTLVHLLKNALKKIKNSEEIVIRAHATGTQENDSKEMKVYRELSESYSLRVSANKYSLGHSLGAAGLLEVVMALESFRNNILPAIPFGIEQNPFVVESEDMKARKVLCVGMGFGGHTVGVLLEKVE